MRWCCTVGYSPSFSARAPRPAGVDATGDGAAGLCAMLRQRTTPVDRALLAGEYEIGAWFLYTNALARPLGLWPYKDVFRSDGHGGSTDPMAEAALAAEELQVVAAEAMEPRAEAEALGPAIRETPPTTRAKRTGTPAPRLRA